MIESEDLHQQGRIAFKSGDTDLAKKLLSQVIESGDAAPGVFADLGVINRELKSLEIARDLLTVAVDLEPDNAGFNYNLALVFGDLNEFLIAEEYYLIAIQLNPNMPAAHNNLGNIKKNRKDYEGALNCYRQAIRIDKNYITAYRNLADLHEVAGNYKSAKSIYKNAIYIRPDSGLRIREALSLPFILDSIEQISECRDELSTKLDDLLADDLILTDPVREVGSANFLLPYHGCNDRKIQVKIADLYQKICPSLSFVAPHSQEWMAGLEGGKPRIGFVSSFFHDHTITMLNKNLIFGLPKARFEVFIFSFSRVEDAVAKNLRSSAQNFVLLSKNLDDARLRIADAELDILYYTDIGMDPLTYFLGFSRLAPIQCVSWGHPITTGLPNIDYFMSSHLTEPENALDAYSEKLFKFEGLPSCVSMPTEFEFIEKDNKFSKQNILCPQSLFKFHPDFDIILGQILRIMPKAKIQIIDGSYPTWSSLLKARMMKKLYDVVDRIEIIPRCGKLEVAKLMRAADVILDTPHFSGGMTTYESLAVGTPVVTLPGDFMRGRVSFGIYRKMDMMHCVAEDAQEYVEITRRLCLDEAFGRMVKTQVRDGHKNIFDDRTTIDRHARFFEQKMFE
jgi:predicted O-linked N-acetylglucosamine transferase (SPINDLY family)